MKDTKFKVDARRLTYLSVLTAIVFLLQVISLGLRFATFSLTFVFVPVVIGVAMCGIGSGVWLGAVFAAAVFATGDAALFLSFDVFGTVVTVFVKGMLAGLVAGLVYRLFEKKNRYLAVALSALIAPIVNTGVFFLGCLVFFMDDISVFFGLNGEGVVAFIITTIIGINFIIEVIVNLCLTPAVYRLIEIKKGKK